MREQRPLPPTRELVVAEFARILNLNLVQRVTIEANKPIVFERLVPNDGELPPELEAQDLYSDSRNAEMLSYAGKLGPFEHLFHAFHLLEQRNAVAKGFICGDQGTVKRWFKFDPLSMLPAVYGVPLYGHEDVPDDILILVAADKANPDEVKFSLLIPMDLPKSATCPNAGKVD